MRNPVGDISRRRDTNTKEGNQRKGKERKGNNMAISTGEDEDDAIRNHSEVKRSEGKIMRINR